MKEYIIVNINAKLQPDDREELYEEPLNELLKEKLIGEVTGGGTYFCENREIECCEIELEVSSYSKSNIDMIIKILESFNVPKDSTLFMTSTEKKITFGKTQGLAIYLNGKTLPDETYENCNLNVVYDEITNLLKGIGSIQSHWQGESESAFYMYGSSFDEMKNKIKPFLDTYPLCESCRIVQIA